MSPLLAPDPVADAAIARHVGAQSAPRQAPDYRAMFVDAIDDIEYLLRVLDRHAPYRAASTVAIYSRELTRLRLIASLCDGGQP